MIMLALVLNSVRHRLAAFLACWLSLFLGGIILMTFSSLLETALAPEVDAASRDTLATLAGVVGGWGLIIVLFAVVSTLTLLVRQRSDEMALLKCLGAHPRQVVGMIVGETALVAAAASLAAVPFAMLAGGLFFRLLQDSGQVTSGIAHSFGPIAILLGVGLNLVGATSASWLAAWRAARLDARQAMVEGALENPAMTRAASVAGRIFLAVGICSAAVTAAVFHGKGMNAMTTSGQAIVWSAIGLAIFGAPAIRTAAALLARPLPALAGVVGELAMLNLHVRTAQMARVLTPIIMFTSMATGTLYIQAIENSAPPAAATAAELRDRATVETLNFVSVAMIVVFAAVMLINTVVAATAHRMQEFGQYRLAGSTSSQVLGMVGAEALVLASAGVVLGSVATLLGVVPYSFARTGSALPDVTGGIYVGIVTVAVTLTVATSLAVTGRLIRVPAVDATGHAS
jgi:putative ABC transport system permease protein